MMPCFARMLLRNRLILGTMRALVLQLQQRRQPPQHDPAYRENDSGAEFCFDAEKQENEARED
jgi:hypothetical protein